MNKLSDEKTKELKETFDFYDKDQDGCLDIHDLQDLFKSKGVEISDDAVQDMINEVDYDGNGTIEFQEFLLINQKRDKNSIEDTLRTVF